MRALIIIALLLAPLAASAKLDAVGYEEVGYLLSYIEKSNSRFIRSGTEYGAKEAADHLRMKLQRAGSRVKTADDFIKGIATKSYLLGTPYLIKTADGKTFPTGPWLTEALARHRKSKR